jgi:hypothetical protein
MGHALGQEAFHEKMASKFFCHALILPKRKMGGCRTGLKRSHVRDGPLAHP